MSAEMPPAALPPAPPEASERPSPDDKARLAPFEAPVFDALIEAAQAVLDLRVATLALEIGGRYWVGHGTDFEPSVSSWAGTLYPHAMAEARPLVVTDAAADARFADYVRAEPRGYRTFVGVPIRDRDGSPIGLLCGLDRRVRAAPSGEKLDALVKLTDAAVATLALRRSEAALRRKSDLLQAILDASNQAVSAFDADLRLVAWNRLTAEMLRVVPEQIYHGAPCEDFLSRFALDGAYGDGDPTALAADRARQLRSCHPFLSELRFPDGQRVETRATPLPGGGFVATHTDVTEARRRARRLRREAARSRVESRVAEIANSAFSLDDALGALLRDACETMRFAFGAISTRSADGSTLLPTGIRYLRDPDSDFPRAWRPGSPLRGRSRAGSGVAFTDAHPALEAGPAEVGGAELGGLVFTLSVLGQAYVIECFGGSPLRPSPWYGEVLTYLGRQLEHVAARDRVRRLKDGFVSSVNHELRTPLTAIAGTLDLVGSGLFGALPEEAKPLLEIAQANTRRLSRLIEDILGLEHAEDVPRPFALSRQSVAPLVIQAVDEVSDLTGEAGVTVRVEAAAGEAPVHAARLKQAVRSLLSNAIKFSPPGEEIVVRMRSTTSRVRISVIDHGPGIPEDFRASLFTAFAQVDTSDSRRASGTGLGLAVTKSIADRLGAALSYETETGAGTTFHIDLAVAESPRSSGPARCPAN